MLTCEFIVNTLFRIAAATVSAFIPRPLHEHSRSRDSGLARFSTHILVRLAAWGSTRVNFK